MILQITTAFYIGLVVGVVLGFFVAALASAASAVDRFHPEMRDVLISDYPELD